ncbi:protein zyg-11 homolog B-like [Acanthaster planci]|uniref:Protein zyg-11 homolog B-like n=1 Tax=Acanthaster planci TaxID=133434 RepID=A0A8B7ZW39_ACAPL|nr:protein zyg-11 homolog B-like [Acanthaster planci]
MGTASPETLQTICLQYISCNMSKLCSEILVTGEGDHTESRLVFKNPDTVIHGDLAESLLCKLSENGQLTDTALTLFANRCIMCLRRACIKKASLTSRGLRALAGHQLLELDAAGVQNVNVNDIIGALGEWTRKHIRWLNVSGCTFLNNSKFCIVISLPQLRNLRHLNVSYTEFGNNLGLECVAEGLSHLESLDISGTLVYSIQPLLRLKRTLKSLCMFHTRVPEKDLISVVLSLEELRHLDISQDVHPMMDNHQHPSVNTLLEAHQSLPHLTSLDISGRDNVQDAALRCFVQQRTRLRFLGLTLTQGMVRTLSIPKEMCGEDFLISESHEDFSRNLKVTGHATEEQIEEALRCYGNRPNYVHKLLCSLFNMTLYLEKAKPHIIKLILPEMKSHPHHLGVQMAASACLYNLTKHHLADSIHVSDLSEMVHLTLDAMEAFPSQQQLQKNALLTLCSDRILQDVNFDRYRASKMVMDCLFVFDDAPVTRMSVAICSILAAKISTEQTTLLGTKRNMQKLLQIVKQKADTLSVDITLKFTLSALWNLTDESPSTCAIFINEGGLDLFIHILEIFPDQATLQTKVLGLINNIAEVPGQRDGLLRNDFIEHCRMLLDSKQIEVSYFAAGIIAHLLKEGPEYWTLPQALRLALQDSLLKNILAWKNPAGEMVAYRSFSPFFPLLKCNIAEVQLWSVWAIQHVCTKNASRYCPMLVQEGGQDLLQEMVSSRHIHSEVHKVAKSVLEMVAAINSKSNQT